MARPTESSRTRTDVPTQRAQESSAPESGTEGQPAQGSMATYVYGIVSANHPCVVENLDGVGEPASALRRLDAEGVTAVVSDAPPGLRAKRRDVLAHQHVLEELGRQGTVLPMRFGVVARDEDSLRQELVEDNEAHLAILADLAGRAEFNVKVFCDEEMLIREAALNDPSVQRLREHTDTIDERIQLGEAVAAAIEARELAIEQGVLETLAPRSTRHVRGPQVKGAAANASFLVDSDDAEEFVAAVEELGAALGEDIRIQRTGPLPPYSFVSVREEE